MAKLKWTFIAIFQSSDDLNCGEIPFASSVRSSSELNELNLNQLNTLLEELESAARETSAVLVQELAYREELDFEQEQKDTFIARLDELHCRLERRRRRSSVPINTTHQHNNWLESSGEAHQMFRSDVSPLRRQRAQIEQEADDAFCCPAASTVDPTLVARERAAPPIISRGSILLLFMRLCSILGFVFCIT